MSKKLLGIFLLVFIISSACISLLPAAHAAEPSLQAKSISFLSDVVGVKTDTYTITRSTLQADKIVDAPSKVADLRFSSAGSSFRVTCSYVKDTLALFYLSDIDGNLKLEQPAANTVDAAKSLLSSYQQETGDTDYGKFAQMLNTVIEGEKVSKVAGDVKLEVSNTQQNTINYMWTYIDQNGVPAERKNVCLTYEYGTLKALYNNWPLYSIAQTENKLSAKDAVEIAMETAQNYSYTIINQNGTQQTISCSGFNISPKSYERAKLIYVNSVNQEYARGGDTYKMYLAWCVPLGFESLYPGDVSGLTVILWADTGRVCSVSQMITEGELASSLVKDVAASNATTVEQPASTGQPLQPTVEEPILQPSQIPGVSAAAGMVFVSLGSCKMVGADGKKRRFSNARAIMFCTLILLSALFFINTKVPTASAVSSGSNSRIYSVPNAIGYYNATANSNEANAATDICSYIEDMCNIYGYSGRTNNSVAYQQDVLNMASYDEEHYDGTMVFHIGHVDGNSRDGDNPYKDNSNSSLNDIAPCDVSQHTDLGKHFFVFLWVCSEAPAQGVAPNATSMAAAWLHRYGDQSLDADGFGANHDSSNQCYISFFGYSPMVSDYVNTTNGIYYPFAGFGSSFPCGDFIRYFYNYALSYSLSVSDALDHASWQYFGCPYTQTILNTGYNCWLPAQPTHQLTFLRHEGYWPADYQEDLKPYLEQGEEKWPDCVMRVFGDSSIHLTWVQTTHPVVMGYDSRGYRVYDLVHIGDENGSVSGVTNQPFPSVTLGTHWIWADSDPCYLYYTITINGYTYDSGPVQYTFTSTPPTIRIDYIFDPNYDPPGGPPGVLWGIFVGEEGGGTTDPPPGVSYVSDWLGSGNVTITALPDCNYTLDYWNIADVGMETEFNVTDNPLSIQPAPYLAVTAHFRYEPVKSLTIPACLHGSTSLGSDVVYEYPGGKYVPVTAVADDGYVLNYWLKDSAYAGSANTILLNMDHNITLQPVFRLAVTNYTLTLSCGGNGAINASGTLNQLEGTRIGVCASPDSGYYVEWLLDGNVYSFDQNVTVTVRSDQTLQACFVDYDPSVGGLNELFENYQGGAICGFIRGQNFTCPFDCYTDSVVAGLEMGITNNVYYAEAAVYQLDSLSGDWVLLEQTPLTGFVWTGQEWSTFYLPHPLELHCGVNYLVVLWSYTQDYGLRLAWDYDYSYSHHNGFVYQDDWECLEAQSGEFPSALSNYGGDYVYYSLYCPITPYPT
jgi:hypothetical protein